MFCPLPYPQFYYVAKAVTELPFLKLGLVLDIQSSCHSYLILELQTCASTLTFLIELNSLLFLQHLG